MRMSKLINYVLKEEVHKIGADACITLYICDPVCRNYYYLAGEAGAKYNEAIAIARNPTFIEADRNIEKMELDRVIYSIAKISDDMKYIGEDAMVDYLYRANKKRNKIFCRFVNRENVNVRLSLAIKEDAVKLNAHGYKCVLNVNFRNNREIGEDQVIHFRRLLENIYDDILINSTDRNYKPLGFIPSAVYDFAFDEFGVNELTDPMQMEWNSIYDNMLKATFNALNLDIHADAGTIHSYNSETGLLSRICAYGVAEGIGQTIDVKDGKGVIAWVALRKQPLIIADLEKSAFGYRDDNGSNSNLSIYIRSRPGMKSELAIPIMHGNKVVAVLNIESSEANKFAIQSISYLMYGCSRIALFAKYVKECSLQKSMLRICSEYYSGLALSRNLKPLDDLAKLACDALGASLCDIIKHNKDDDSYSCIGSSYSESNNVRVRSTGWTRQLCADNTKSVVAFFQWSEHESRFIATAYEENGKEQLLTPEIPINEYLIELHTNRGVVSEIGMPILYDKEIVGVMYLCYKYHMGDSKRLAAIEVAKHYVSLVSSVMWGIARSKDNIERHVINNLLHSLTHDITSTLLDITSTYFDKQSTPQSHKLANECIKCVIDYLSQFQAVIQQGRIQAIERDNKYSGDGFSESMLELCQSAIRIANATANSGDDPIPIKLLVEEGLQKTNCVSILKVVLVNILHNSLKYTHASARQDSPLCPIDVRVYKDDLAIVIETSDLSGLKISDDEYRQWGTKPGDHRDYSEVRVTGSGYGLYVTRGLVFSSLGGTLQFKQNAALDKIGTTAIVKLPISSLVNSSTLQF